MLLLTNLLVIFACNFCYFGGSFEEVSPSQASILHRAESGLIAAYDAAKTTIKE